MVEMPSGEIKTYHKTRAPRRTPSAEQLSRQIEELRSHDVEQVWVSYKLPLLVFLFPAILPMALLGDITTIILAVVGL